MRDGHAGAYSIRSFFLQHVAHVYIVFSWSHNSPTALLGFQQRGACCNDRALMWRLLCAGAVDTDALARLALSLALLTVPPVSAYACVHHRGEALILMAIRSTTGSGNGRPQVNSAAAQERRAAGCTVMRGATSQHTHRRRVRNLGLLCQIHQSSVSRLAPRRCRMTRTRMRGSSSARHTVFLGADFAQYVRRVWCAVLVKTCGVEPTSGSCRGAGAGVHRALPTLIHHSHAMLPPQLSPSTNPVPSRPRIVILPAALSVSHRSPNSRVSVLAAGNAIPYLPPSMSRSLRINR
jgi:hypothetical protein